MRGSLGGRSGRWGEWEPQTRGRWGRWGRWWAGVAPLLRWPCPLVHAQGSSGTQRRVRVNEAVWGWPSTSPPPATQQAHCARGGVPCAPRSLRWRHSCLVWPSPRALHEQAGLKQEGSWGGTQKPGELKSRGKNPTPPSRAAREEAELKHQEKVGLGVPTSIDGFKAHPDFVLQRHITKYEVRAVAACACACACLRAGGSGGVEVGRNVQLWACTCVCAWVSRCLCGGVQSCALVAQLY